MENTIEKIAYKYATMVCGQRGCSTYRLPHRDGRQGNTTIPIPGKLEPGDEQYVRMLLYETIITAAKEIPTISWQPIETAPKDGTLIDLFIDGERYVDCRWGDPNQDMEDWASWYQRYTESWGSAFPVDLNPTHWMPRPSPPGGNP